MTENKKSSDGMSGILAQNLDQARSAMENYVKFFDRSMAASPLAGSELTKKLTEYAEQNVGAAFGFAQKLTQAKDLQDMVRIQTEHFQALFQTLTEQAKDLSETATKAVLVK